jgi:hypothetical protein
MFDKEVWDRIQDQSVSREEALDLIAQVRTQVIDEVEIMRL